MAASTATGEDKEYPGPSSDTGFSLKELQRQARFTIPIVWAARDLPVVILALTATFQIGRAENVGQQMNVLLGAVLATIAFFILRWLWTASFYSPRHVKALRDLRKNLERRRMPERVRVFTWQDYFPGMPFEKYWTDGVEPYFVFIYHPLYTTPQAIQLYRNVSFIVSSIDPHKLDSKGCKVLLHEMGHTGRTNLIAMSSIEAGSSAGLACLFSIAFLMRPEDPVSWICSILFGALLFMAPFSAQVARGSPKLPAEIEADHFQMLVLSLMKGEAETADNAVRNSVAEACLNDISPGRPLMQAEVNVGKDGDFDEGDQAARVMMMNVMLGRIRNGTPWNPKFHLKMAELLILHRFPRRRIFALCVLAVVLSAAVPITLDPVWVLLFVTTIPTIIGGFAAVSLARMNYHLSMLKFHLGYWDRDGLNRLFTRKPPASGKFFHAIFRRI